MRCVFCLLIALASCGDSPSLDSSEPHERIWAMQRLVGSDRPHEAVRLITPLFDHDRDETVRAFAARCLAQLGTPEAITRVVAKIGSDDALHVRFAAAAALEEFPDATAIPGLMEYVRDPRRESDVALGESAGALVALGVRAIEPLVGLAADTRESVSARTSALSILSRIHEPSIRARIEPLFNDPNRRIAASARESVANLNRNATAP